MQFAGVLARGTDRRRTGLIQGYYRSEIGRCALLRRSWDGAASSTLCGGEDHVCKGNTATYPVRHSSQCMPSGFVCAALLESSGRVPCLWPTLDCCLSAGVHGRGGMQGTMLQHWLYAETSRCRQGVVLVKVEALIGYFFSACACSDAFTEFVHGRVIVGRGSWRGRIGEG